MIWESANTLEDREGHEAPKAGQAQGASSSPCCEEKGQRLGTNEICVVALQERCLHLSSDLMGDLGDKAQPLWLHHPLTVKRGLTT